MKALVLSKALPWSDNGNQVAIRERLRWMQEPRVKGLMKDRVSTSPKRILVVDDEAVIRDLIGRSLEGQRYLVDLAEDGEQAWLKIQSTAYDCILLDLRMPGKSGGELYRLIEERNKQVAKKVIFITGDAAAPDTGDFISDSGNPVLRKPFHLDELHRQILESLEASAQPSP